MKKLCFLSAVLALFFCANAYARPNLFYIGVAYQSSSPKYNKVELEAPQNPITTFKGSQLYAQDFRSAAVFIGVQPFRNLELEAGYFRRPTQRNENQNTGLTWGVGGNPMAINTSSDLEMASLDAIFNLELTRRIKLLALAGGSAIKQKVRTSFMYLDEERESTSFTDGGKGINFGGGLEIKLLETISIRGMVKQTKVYGIDNMKSIFSYSVGLKYTI